MTRFRWRFWLLIAGGSVFGLVLLLWLLAPTITVMVLKRHMPLITGHFDLRSVSGTGKPGLTHIQAICPLSTARRIIAGTAPWYVPGWVATDGQWLSGTFTDAPEVSWSLHIDAHATQPTITGTIPAQSATDLIRRLARPQNLIFSTLDITRLSVTGHGTHADVGLAAHAVTTIAGQTMSVQIDDAQLSAEGSAPDTNQSGSEKSGLEKGLLQSIELPTITGNASLLGDLSLWRALIESRLRVEVLRQTDKTAMPAWWPLDATWQIEVMPMGMVEL